MSTDTRPLALFPHFLFRTTGFGFEALEGLACPRSLELAEELLATEERLADLVRRFRETVRRRVRRGEATHALSAADRKVRRRRPVPAGTVQRLRSEGRCAEAAEVETYNQLLAAVACGIARGEELLSGELEAARERLWQAAAAPDFQEAVLLSSPGAFAGLERAVADRGKRRRAETKALLYLQRFAAKNDTISFFGPVTWGRFDPDARAACEVRFAGEALTSREVFFEHWGTEALARAMEADPELTPALPWRVHYPFEWNAGEQVLYRDTPMSGRSRRVVDPATAALLTALAAAGGSGVARTGRAAVAAACRQSRLAAAEIETAFERLRRQGVLRALGVGVEALRPLDGLLAQVRAVASPAGEGRRRWEARLEELLALRDRLGGAPLGERRRLLLLLEQRFSEWSGHAARRNGGRTYAGRNVVYEDCTRHPQRFVVGGDLHRRLAADLADLVAVQSALMEVVAPHGWRRLRTLWERLAAGGQEVALSRFLLMLSRSIGNGYLQASLVDAEEEAALLDRAEAVLAFHPDGPGRLRVEARDPGVVERMALLRRPVVLGADVMIAAAGPEALAAGDYRFVVGEIQYFPLGYPEYLWSFHPDREAFYRDYQRWIVAPRLAAEPLARVELEPEVTRLIRIERPLAPYVLVDGRGRTYGPDLPQRRITEMTVELEADRLMVRDRAGKRFVLGNPHHDLFLDAAWKLLVKLHQRRCRAEREAGRPMPELSVGERTVLLRRSWEVAAAELPGAAAADPEGWQRAPFAAFLRLQRLRRRRGWPRHLFARVPGEVKPVLADLASPLLLSNLARMAADGDTVTLSEMRPGPGELWFKTSAGHHTSEMRIFLAA